MSSSTSGQAATARAAPKVISGRTSFDFTIGPNPNYPNPPAWGISYHVNGLETPVLQLHRGVNYTFNVKVSTARHDGDAA